MDTLTKLEAEIASVLARCEHGFSTRCPVSDSYSCGEES